jgi:cell pole-organizing protein PopZ
MALQDPQAEPSMEEILASIRRIISEEEQAPMAEPVLDLTKPQPPEDDIVFEAVEPPPAPEPSAPEPAQPPPAQSAAPAPLEGAILSAPTTHAAAGALARLAGSLRIADTPNQTVEGVVRELLKPMLKDWLDHNLPAIVEARVEAELERIARMAR